MAEFGVTGTFFVNTSSIGSGEFLDWTMAAEMARGGMRFGSHAHNHVVLTTLTSERVKEELRVSRQMLEQRLSCADRGAGRALWILRSACARGGLGIRVSRGLHLQTLAGTAGRACTVAGGGFHSKPR